MLDGHPINVEGYRRGYTFFLGKINVYCRARGDDSEKKVFTGKKQTVKDFFTLRVTENPCVGAFSIVLAKVLLRKR